MPKTRAALKSAQNIQQKQKQRLKTEQKKQTSSARRPTQPEPSPENTKLTPTPNAKATQNSRLNEERSPEIPYTKRDAESMPNPTPTPKTNTTSISRTTQPKSTLETPKPTPKPTYRKPLVIWHTNPNKMRRSRTTNLKNKAESTPNLISTPQLQTKTKTTPVGRTTQPKSTPEITNTKPKYPKPFVIWNDRPNKKRRCTTTRLEKDAESTTNATPIPKQQTKLNTSSVRRNAQPKASPEITKSTPTPRAKLTRNSKLNGETGPEIVNSKKDAGISTSNTAARMIIEISDSYDDDDDDDFDKDGDKVGDVDEAGDVNVDDNVATDVDEIGDVDIDADFDEDIHVDANTAPQSIPMYSSTLDTASDMMDPIPEINAAPASPYLGDLMPWVSEVEAVPALGLDPGLGNSKVDATSNIMGLISNTNAGLVSTYRRDLMLSVSEAETEPASGLENRVAGDGILLSDDMYLDMAMDVDEDADMEMHLDTNTGMNMETDMNAYKELNTSPFHTSWKGMYMDPPLTAEERGWDFSNVEIEEVDGLFGEMERGMSGDMDTKMEMRE